MRPAILVTLLVLVCALLSANIVLSLTHRGTQLAFSQDALRADSSTLATAVTQNGETFVFVFDREHQALTYYRASRSDGLQLKGIRKLTWDFQHREFLPGGKKLDTSVTAMENRIKQIQRQQAQRQAAAQGKRKKNP